VNGDDLDQVVGSVAKHDLAFGGDLHRLGEPGAQARRRRIRVAIDFHPRKARSKLACQVLGQPIRVFHRVELDHPLGLCDVIGAEREDLGPDEVCGLHRILAAAERACACKPSPSARVAAMRPRRAAPSGDTPITLVRF
jgi:hypothetical protein